MPVKRININKSFETSIYIEVKKFEMKQNKNIGTLTGHFFIKFYEYLIVYTFQLFAPFFGSR